jgi:hypothetical protein
LDTLIEVLTDELSPRIEGRRPECSASHWTDALIEVVTSRVLRELRLGTSK